MMSGYCSTQSRSANVNTVSRCIAARNFGIALIVAGGRDRSAPMPFGPYLAAAGWLALMWGPELMGSALHYAGLDG